MSKRTLMMVAVSLWALVAYGARGALSADDKNAGASDRERAGLRGPVQTCVEETTNADTEQKSWSTTTLYDRAGHILLRTSSGSGKPGWVERYTYSPDGRLLKKASGQAEGRLKQTIYSYDRKGRLVRVAAEGQPATTFEYDEQGRKTSVQVAGPKHTNEAVDISLRDGSDEAFAFTATAICDAVGACASTKTIYNQQDHPAEAELRDRNGTVIMRSLRNFDRSGSVTGERQETEHPELMVPEELRGQLNPAQMQAAGKLFAGLTGATSAYAYDAQHRLKEMRIVSPMMGEQVTMITYNEHGDRAEEQVSRSGTEGFSGSLTEQGTIIPGAPSGGMPPEQSDTRYSYLYDDYDNWTQQTVEVRSKPDEPYRTLRTVHRKLMYEPAAQP